MRLHTTPRAKSHLPLLFAIVPAALLAAQGCEFSPPGATQIPSGEADATVADGTSTADSGTEFTDAAPADAAPDAPPGDAPPCTPTGQEGPPGNPVCTDGTDNDCDGTLDGDDLACTTYTNDFSSDTDDFSFGGGWSIDQGQLATPSCTTAEGAFLDGASFTDVAVTATVRVDNPCSFLATPQAGIVARASGAPACNNAAGYFCALDLTGQRAVRLSRLDTGACTTSIAARGASALATDTDYTVELRAVGDQISCTVSGGNLSAPIVVTATDATHASGTVGLAAHDTNSRFDDFSATAL